MRHKHRYSFFAAFISLALAIGLCPSFSYAAGDGDETPISQPDTPLEQPADNVVANDEATGDELDDNELADTAGEATKATVASETREVGSDPEPLTSDVGASEDSASALDAESIDLASEEAQSQDAAPDFQPASTAEPILTTQEETGSEEIYACLYPHNGEAVLVFQNTKERDYSIMLDSTEAFKAYEVNLDSGNSFPAWLASDEEITKVEFRTKVTPKSTANWFAGCVNLKSVAFGDPNKDTAYLDFSECQSMARMFAGCENLVTVDFSSARTPSLKDTSDLFSGCAGLRNVSLDGSFDTSKVTTMARMFHKCSSLEHVFLTTLNTTSVEDMTDMFSECSSLLDLDLSYFDTSSVVSMSRMFADCSKLASVNISKFNVSSVASFSGMFRNCCMLSQVDVSAFNTEAGADFAGMFQYCEALEELVLSGFDMGSNPQVQNMLDGCQNLRRLVLGDTTALTGVNESTDEAFTAELPEHSKTSQCSEKWISPSGQSLTASQLMEESAAGVYTWAYNISSRAYLLDDGTLLVYKQGSLPEGHLLSEETEWTGFEEAEFTEQNLPPWHDWKDEVKNVVIDSSFGTINPISMAYWFYDMPELVSIDFRGVDVTATKTMRQMIYNCPKLDSIVLGGEFAFAKDATLLPTAMGMWMYSDAETQGEFRGYPQEFIEYYSVENNKNGKTVEGTYRWFNLPLDFTLAAVSAVSNQAYTGSAIEPKITVTYKGEPLTEGVDYEVRYEDNFNIGTATIRVIGNGTVYSPDTILVNFNIVASLANATIASISNQTYTGKAITPAPKVTWKGKTLTANKDYTVSYKNNTKVGTATLVVSGKGNFTGSTSKTFTIVAKSASGSTKSTSTGSTKSTSTRSTSTKSTSGTAKKASYKAGATKMPVQSTSKWTLKNCKLKVVSGKGVVTVKGSTVTAKKKGTAKLVVVDTKGKKLATKTVKVYKLTGKYVVQSAVKSNLCLDIKNRSKANGGNLIVWSKNKQTNQKFTFTRKGSAYTIKAVNSGKALEVAGSSKKAGANVCQNKASGKANQQWKITVDAKNRLTFVNKKSGKVLDCAGTTAKKGVNVVQGKSTGGLDQKWVLK